jgi:hypothetical protein
MDAMRFLSIRIVAIATGFCGAIALGPMQAQAETIKQSSIGCVSEDTLNELLKYINKGDRNGMGQLLAGGQCVVLSPGEQVSVIDKGFMTATLRYRGKKLYTVSEAIR